MTDDASTSEALELISTAHTRLLGIRELAGDGDARDEHDPDELNEAFRAVHSLASLLPAEINFSGHVLCNRVDDFRMSKLGLTATNLDQVIAGLDLLGRRLRTPAEVEAAAMSAMEQQLAELGKQAVRR